MDVATKVIVVGLAIAERLLVRLSPGKEAFDEVNESDVHFAGRCGSGMRVSERTTERSAFARRERASSWKLFDSRGDDGKDILSHAKQYTVTYVSLGGVHHVAPGQASAACRRIQLHRCRSRANAQLKQSGTSVPDPVPWLLTGCLLRNVFLCIATVYWLRYQPKLRKCLVSPGCAIV